MQETVESPEAQAAFDTAQAAALGALAVLLVDVRCRAQLLLTDPALARLLAAAARTEGADESAVAERRTVAAKVVASCVQV